jgi:hypothetical protein
VTGVSGPLPGLSLRRTSQGIAVLRVHHTCDPDKSSAEWRAKERAKFTSEAIFRQEIDIEYDAKQGALVYSEFEPQIHVIPNDQVPAKLTRYMSIDPHPRTPHAMLWVGIDQWSDWYVYRELWDSQVYGQARQLRDNDSENSYTVKEYVGAIVALEGNSIEWHNEETDDEYGIFRRGAKGENIVYRFMDQAGKAFRASGEGQQVETYAKRYDRFGIQCVDPKKSHESGEDAIRQLLKSRRHDTKGAWPRIHIAARCEELIMEFRRHRWKSIRKWTADRELFQEGSLVRTHMLDNLRYLATGDLCWIGNLAS